MKAKKQVKTNKGKLWGINLKTPEERSANARNAANIQWATKRAHMEKHLVEARKNIDHKKRMEIVSKELSRKSKEGIAWRQEVNKKISKGVRKYALSIPKEIRSEKARKRGRKLWDNPKSVATWQAKRDAGWFKGNGFIYNDIKMRSRYECRFANYLDIKNIDWEYEKSFIKYVDEIKNRRYLPDFYLPEFDLYVEIKGWVTESTIDKLYKVSSQNNIHILIIDGTTLKSFGKYAEVEFTNIKKKLFQANTEPSQIRNSLEGVETRDENLIQWFTDMKSTLQEKFPTIFCGRYSPNLHENVRSKE